MTQTPVQIFFKKRNLRTHLFLNLTYPDLLRCSGVCTLWRNHIIVVQTWFNLTAEERDNEIESQKLQQLTYKSATPLTGPDPHFYSASALARSILSNDGPLKDQPTLSIAQENTKKFLDGDRHEETMNTPGYGYTRMKIRNSVRGVRFTSGWPEGYREIHCYSCDRFHTRFRWDNLHPLLKFLGDMPLCISGDGSRLMMEVKPIHSRWAPPSCFEDYFQDVLAYATELEAVYNKMQELRMEKDMFTIPKSTMLVVNRMQFTVYNNWGLQVGEVVRMLIRQFNASMLEEREGFWKRLPGIGPGHTLYCFEPDIKRAFGTRDNWDEHKKNTSKIDEEWQKKLNRVHDMMCAVDSWETGMK